MKWSEWSPHEKVNWLSSGPMTMQINMPMSAVSSDQARTTRTKWLMAASSPRSNNSDTCFTAENEMPRLVA